MDSLSLCSTSLHLTLDYVIFYFIHISSLREKNRKNKTRFSRKIDKR